MDQSKLREGQTQVNTQAIRPKSIFKNKLDYKSLTKQKAPAAIAALCVLSACGRQRLAVILL